MVLVLLYHRLSSTKEGTAAEGMVSVEEEGMNEDLIGITAILRVAPAHLVCCLSLTTAVPGVRPADCSSSTSLGLYSLQSRLPSTTLYCDCVLHSLSTMVPQGILTPAPGDVRDDKNNENFVIYGSNSSLFNNSILLFFFNNNF